MVDAPDAGVLGTTLNTIALLPDVYSASLVFHAIDAGERLTLGRTAMTAPKLDRRQVLKLEAAAMAARGGGMPAPALAANLVTERDASELKWDKAPCRFCGTGCSVMVATKDNRVVATHGDIKSEVNRGLNCVKGYFLSKIMYGHDRLTQPMLRKTDGKYDKNGEFTPVSWDEAFDIMAEKFKAALKKRGPSGVGMFGSGQWTIWEGYAALETVQGRLPLQQHRSQCPPLHGVGGGRHHAHLRHRRADGLLRRHRGRRRVRAVGLEHGGDAPDPVDAGGRPPASRAACARRGAVDLRAPLVRPRRHRHGVQAADRPLSAQRHRQPHHQDRPGEQGFRRRAHRVQARPDRHRLRAAARTSAAEEGDRRAPRPTTPPT